jgi:hypothetical protein
VLLAFEQTAADRKDNLDEWILRFQQVDATRQTTEQIINVLNKGRYTRRSDPNFIMQNIERLTTSSRGYQNGIAQLRDSGELAVPFMVQYLRDSTKTQYHAAIRRALRDLGRYSLNPLVAATDMKDADVLAMVCTTLGDLATTWPCRTWRASRSRKTCPLRPSRRRLTPFSALAASPPTRSR